MPVESFRFGEFELDGGACELLRDDRRVRLQEKPRQLLTRLLLHRGKLVTREVLQAELWPADLHVDREHGLNAAMRKLRQALGESATEPRYIETVPRQGYRFIAPVTVKTAQEPVRPMLLAVLPLRSPQPNPTSGYLAEGLTEEMITQLGRLDPRRLGVIAHSSVLKYGEQTTDLDRVAHELGVDLCLEGTARSEAGRIRVSVQLVRVEDRVVVWSNSYENEASDLFAIQRDVSARVAEALELELLPERSQIPAPDPEAHDAYLRGSSCWNQRTPESLREALDWFRRSVAIAPRFAAAHAALAECYHLFEDYGMESPGEAFPLARTAALRALELDPLLPQAHTALAFIRHRFDRDWQQAEDDYRRAVELNPSSSYAHHRLAEFLSQLLRHEEAFESIGRARRIDPFSTAVRTVEAWILFHARRYPEAERVTRSILDGSPRFAVARFVLGRVLAQCGSKQQALVETRQAADDAPDNSFILAAVGVMAARAGQQELSEKMLASLARMGRNRFVSPYLTAKINVALGRFDRALQLLEEAVDVRSGWVVDLAVDPELDDLRGYPGFAALSFRVGLPVRMQAEQPRQEPKRQ